MFSINAKKIINHLYLSNRLADFDDLHLIWRVSMQLYALLWLCWYCILLWGQMLEKTPFWDGNRHFQAKDARYSNFRKIKTTATIPTKKIAQWYIQGAPKNNHLGKIHCPSYSNRFFHQIYSFHRGGLRPHKQQISLQYKNYVHLNLKVHFSKWPTD